MPTTCDNMQLLVQAELDGELDAAEAVELATHLEGCAVCADFRTNLEALSSQIRRGGVTRYKAPATLLEAVLPRRSMVKRAGMTRGHGVSFAAGLAIAAAVMLAIFPIRNDAVPDIIAAHVRALQPGHLMDVESTDQHTVKPWFNGRLDFSPPVRNLSSQGFPLVGGRLDVLQGQPVAVLVYRRDKHIIDIFISQGDRVVSTAKVQGYNIIGWTQDGFSYQAVSDLNTKELGDLIQLLRAPG